MIENMEKSIFTPFRRFDDMVVAKEFLTILEEKGIGYKIEEYAKEAGISLYNQSEKEILIKLRQEDFEEANSIMSNENIPDEISADYYLYDFTDEELIEVLVKPHEWGEIDGVFAPKILIQRGYDLNKLDIEQKKETHIQSLEQPQKESTLLLILGYLFAINGGLLGLAIGWGLDNTKTILPNGKQVYVYTEDNRKHGARIFRLSTIMIAVYISIFIIWLALLVW